MNAVIYARYSSSGQTEQSIEGQLRDDYEFAKREGYNVIGEYIDRAQTGRNDDRDNFQRMISDAAKRQFQVIIVWKLDRFARNRYDSAIYKSKLKKYNVRVLSCQENITDNPEGIILEGMLEAMAEYYSANLSVNVRRGQRETMLKGRYCGGHIPYGYKSVDGHLIPDERTAPIIRYIFEQYAKGTPKRKIIDDLTSRGVTSPEGKPLRMTSFQQTLKNPAYYGQFTWNGHIVEGCAEPIITKELFDEVQLRIEAHRRSPAASTANVAYLLSGKLYCGHCGATMVGECGRSSTGKVHYYYSCACKKKHHNCDKRNERKEDLESYVLTETIRYVLQPDNIKQIAASVVSQYKSEFNETKIAEMEHDISRMESDLNKLVDSLIEAPKSAHSRIYAKMESIEAQKADLEVELSKLRIAASTKITESEVAKWIQQFTSDTDTITPERKQSIIDTFISCIYIYNDKIAIYYNTSTTPPPTPPTLKTLTDSTPPHPPNSSNLNAHGTPFTHKSERQFVFIQTVFGLIIHMKT